MISIYLFDDPFLDTLLETNKVLGVCEISGRSEWCIDESILKPYFDNILQLYHTYHPSEAPAIFVGGSQYDEGVFVWESIENDFGIFNPQNDQEDNKEIIEIMYYEDPRDGGWNPYIDCPVYRFDQDFEYDDGPNYEYEYWNKFKNELKFKNRFFPDNSLDFSQLTDIFKFRSKIIKADDFFYRARTSDILLTTNEMGPPPSYKSPPGRANPKGISYLYLGKTEFICEKEIKINKDETYTIGKFQVKKPLTIVDLSSHTIISPFEYGAKIKSYIQSIDIIRMYVKEMSSRADADDPYFDYLPTQYICEKIKKEGYDGIQFHSSLSDERDAINLIVFNQDKVSCLVTHLRKAR